MSPLLTTVNPIQAFALTFCASCFLSIGARADATPVAITPKAAQPEGTVTKSVKAKEDLPNFHQVHPFLYRGGEPTKEGLKKIKEMGVTTILDLRNPGEKKYDEKQSAKDLGMRYISMPMNSKAPTTKQIKRLLDEIDRARAKVEVNGSSTDNTAKEAVFVHCAHGSDRTGCMIGIWRVKRDGYDYETAYQEMRKYWFTPKFTNLSGAVKTAASDAKPQ
ncbi:MAG: tyrosine-protein phosphatase [Candidatus Melainabacteria bacterium]|nr:tyrosine-protein phosphatase [Candidatus Melainabacteria bacterium]